MMRSSLRRVRRVLVTVIASFALGGSLVAASSAGAAEPLPDGTRVFATLVDDRIAAVDATSGAVVATASLPGVSTAPHPDLIADPSAPVLYAPAGGEIAIVDAATLSATRRLVDPGGSTFTSLAVSPDGLRVYGLTTDQHVVGFDPATGAAVHRVPTSAAPATAMPRQLAATDSAVYVIAGAAVDVITRDAPAVTSQIALAGTGGSLAVDPLMRRLYAVQQAPNVTNVAVVNLDSGLIVGNPEHLLPLTLQPIVLSPNGQSIVTGTTNPDEAQSFNSALQEPGGTRAVLSGPIGLPVIAPDHAAVYVPLRGTNTIAAFTGMLGARSGEFVLPATVLAATAMRLAVGEPPPVPPESEEPAAAPPAPGPDPARPALAESGIDAPLPLALLLLAAGLTLALATWPTSRRRMRAPRR